MRVHVRLIALAVGEGHDGTTLDLAPGATVADALAVLALPGDEAYVTLLDDRVVPPAARARTPLHEGAQLTVFPPIKGG